MSVPGPRIGDEGGTCGMGYHDTDKISTSDDAGRSDQWVPLYQFCTILYDDVDTCE